MIASFLNTHNLNLKKTTFLLIFITFISCYEQEKVCKDFKTGTYSFELEVKGKKEKSVFTRTDSTQIETFRGKTDTATVRWVNDCEFVLRKINPKKMDDKKGIHIKILTTTQNSYTFEYSFVGDGKKQKGTAIKIK